MAEVLLNHLGKGGFRAWSAGSHPNGKVNPHSIETLEEFGLPTVNLRSKSWDEFAKPEAPPLDFIITVCDNAAGETCPVWPGHPITAHWGVEDPAAVEGTDEQKRKAFRDAANILKRRVELLVALPIAKLDAQSLRTRLREIGKS